MQEGKFARRTEGRAHGEVLLHAIRAVGVRVFVKWFPIFAVPIKIETRREHIHLEIVPQTLHNAIEGVAEGWILNFGVLRPRYCIACSLLLIATTLRRR